ncbi:MAG: hypothetical protein ACHQK9_19220 [Reyranellales bacterium]
MNRLFRSPMGALLARPWVDAVGLTGLRRWYFPLSRLWAAANAAGTDVARFRDEVGGPLGRRWSSDRLGRALARTAVARDAAEAARLAWEDGLFGDGGEPLQLDRRRRLSATRHLATRGLFSGQLLAGGAPLARWQIPSPDAVRAELDAAGRDPARLYAAAIDIATVEPSRSFEAGGVRQYWLRAPTPANRLQGWRGSRTLYARVVEPADSAPRAAIPTVVFGGGLCLELDLMTGGIDPDKRLAELGWRVVNVVSPFHGLRAEADRYGGEPFIATAPVGTIDLIAGQAIETALLIAWCRAAFGGAVALAGISMTSFVAQQVASYCQGWPAEQRPDAVLLISHSGRIEDVAFGGALSAALGLDTALKAGGWSDDDLLRVSRLIDPAASPALPPGRIVSALGAVDRWLPFKDGLAVTERWKLPEANVFRYAVGHLGMPVRLIRDPAPFVRLRQVLEEA